MIIGITTTLNETDNLGQVNLEYIKRIAEIGATPILLSPVPGGKAANQRHANELFIILDGLLLTGGGDIHPCHYMSLHRNNSDGSSEIVKSKKCENCLMDVNENRDFFELELACLAFNNKIPTLGICRGMQVMNVALGGSLHEDLLMCGVTTQLHMQDLNSTDANEEIRIAEDSMLAKIFNHQCMSSVNTFHHQGVKELGHGLKASAWGFDDVIEGIESEDHEFFVGVQWHPEKLDNNSALFEAFATVCQKKTSFYSACL